jgi:hypothetical protein
MIRRTRLAVTMISYPTFWESIGFTPLSGNYFTSNSSISNSMIHEWFDLVNIGDATFAFERRTGQKKKITFVIDKGNI